MSSIYYMDPENGNDANSGLTFALRKKSFGGVAVGIAAGDEVRVIASIDPWSIGNAQWTDNNGNVVLDTAVNVTLDNCDAAWTAVATGSVASATSAGRRQGTNMAQFALGSTYTTGILGFKALAGTLDLSAYQCISLVATWNTSFNNASGNLFLDLCSDSAGVVPIVSLPFPVVEQMSNASMASYASPFLLDNGAALPSGVNSIALRSTARPVTGTTSFTFAVDNIIATKAPNAANHLSHMSVVGKNTSGEPEWHSIQWIDGATINFGSVQDIGANGTQKYRGVTEKVITYALLGLRPTAWSATAGVGRIWNTLKSGTHVAPIRITSGWDRTAMAAQTGYTWINCKRFWQTGFDTNGADYINMDDGRFGVLGGNIAGVALNSSGGVKHVYAGIYGCYVGFSAGQTNFKRYIDVGTIGWSEATQSLDYFYGNNFVFKSRRIFNCKASGLSASNYSTRHSASRVVVGSLDNNGQYGFTSNGVIVITIDGTTFKNNVSGSVNLSQSGGSSVVLNRPILGDASVVGFLATTNSGSEVRVNAANGNRWDNRVYNTGVTSLTDQTKVHGSAAQSIKCTINDYRYADADVPSRTPVARIACFSGKTVTFKTWAQRSDAAAIQYGLAVYAGPVAGIVDTQVVGTAAASTWEQLTITFTPTEDGVVEVFGIVYGISATGAPANGTSAWFSDPSVSST